MKTEILLSEPIPQFSPFELRIQVETLEEAYALYHMFNVSGSEIIRTSMSSRYPILNPPGEMVYQLWEIVASHIFKLTDNL